MQNLLGKLVLGSSPEVQLLDGHLEGLKQSLDDVLVVDDAICQQFPRALHVVEKGVQIGEEDRHLNLTT